MRTVFRLLQPLGLHLTRNHFYEPVPDTRRLPDSLWSKPSELVGIDMNVDAQLALVRQVFPKYVGECSFPDRPAAETEFHFGNWLFEALDAEVLHCLIRHFKPKRIVEIGSGYTTLISARAAVMNQRDGVQTEVTCVEPYPNATLKRGFPGLANLIEKPVQQLDLSLFESLEPNDILFIDSSHVAKIGSDVVYEYLEILPRLRPGVLVHVHDIFLPEDYPREWVVRQHKFWTEQYLLRAFLTFNARYEVVWASSMMSLAAKEEIERAIPSWKGSHVRLPPDLRREALTRDGANVWPVSFWIRSSGLAQSQPRTSRQ
jgi:predicted O-methyltransferase YrrM